MLTKDQAVEIASEFAFEDIKSRIYKVVDTLEHRDRSGMHLPPLTDKCWFIFYADKPGERLSNSATVIAVSKKTGRVIALYTHPGNLL